MLKCNSLNVDEYFKRTGYTGLKEPTLETLTKLCWCHVTTIPHDTLDILIGKKKVLDLDKIYNDLVIRKRGGFCYEQNGLLGAVLEALGYDITLLEGSCFMEHKDAFSNPFDHLLLKIIIKDCAWVVDVGYGAPSFFEPMRFEMMKPQTQMTGIYRFREPTRNTYFCERKRRRIINGNTGAPVKTEITPSQFHVSDDWEIIFKFTGTPRRWEEFEHACENHQNTADGFYTNNSFLEIFHDKSVDVLWGTKLMEMESPDPMTQIIKVTDVIPDYDVHNDVDEEWKSKMRRFMKTRFGVELDVWPVFLSRDFHPL